MEKVIAASRNAHKIGEISAITCKYGMEIISRDDAGIPAFEVEETGSTFEENSMIKAEAIMKVCHCTVIADDSGLSVDFLAGAPGVFSARFAGEGADDAENNEKLLGLLKGVPYRERSAKFVSVVTMLFADGTKLVARGECPGHITNSPVGENGFGYDPLFIPDGYDVTFAQMNAEEKNKISHRAKALSMLEEMLRRREAV